MDNELTVFDVRMIRNLMSSLSDEDIAIAVGKPLQSVRDKIFEITGVEGSLYKRNEAKKIIRQKIKSDRLPRRTKTPKRETEKQIKRSSLVRKQDAERMVARRMRDKPLFKTKQIDYSTLIAVRIDDRTIIYAKPGADPEAIRDKYLLAQKRKADSFKSKPPSTYVKKFKPIS